MISAYLASTEAYLRLDANENFRTHMPLPCVREERRTRGVFFYCRRSTARVFLLPICPIWCNDVQLFLTEELR
jgi:hypothetical protein